MLILVCSEPIFNSILLFAPQKKAEAAHRILEGLGPQVELVSRVWLGGVEGVGWRGWVRQQVLGEWEGGRRKSSTAQHCPQGEAGSSTS